MVEVRKSINIKYDSNNKHLLDEYFATSSHSEIIKKVIGGILGGNNRAHIAFGPYGAGKSFISTILTGFSMKNYNKKDVSSFTRKFLDVDTESSNLFDKVYDHGVEYIPILINGYEGKFDKTLIRSLKEQLLKNEISVFDRKPVVSKIVSNWEHNYPTVYNEFLIFLSNSNVSVKDFYDRINDDNLFNKFSLFYENITAGAMITSADHEELISTYEKAANILKDKNKGIFLVFDEFGRMLQNIDPNELNQFMQQLQDLAELANNSCKNLSLLFIAHKPISHYFTYLDKEMRSEFSKIEKRFSITSIQSDHATFINIASQFVKELNLSSISEKDFRSLSKLTNKYKLFSDNFNQTEIDNLIIKNSYPIHPVTMFLLPMISKVFGQNERTLFSFLSDTSHDGFLGTITRSKDTLYYPDQLADYFFLNIEDEVEIKEINILKTNIGFIKSMMQEPFSYLSERIYKLIAVWGITSANNYVPLNDEFISFALGEDKSIIEKVLDELSLLKLIRYNREKKYWFVIESNSIDIDAEVKSKNMFIQNHLYLLNQTLNFHNPFKYLYPNEHNAKHEITRFALVKINLKDYPDASVDSGNHDFLYECFVNDSKRISNAEIITYIDYDQEKLIYVLKRLTVVDILLNDRTFLHNFKNASVDLEFERNRLNNELQGFYTKILNNTIIIGNKKTRVSGKEQFSKILSNYADEVFNKTLFIRNDQINMFVITTQQQNATLKVIEAIIENERFDLDDLFSGSKPEDLIYYSLKTTSSTEEYKELKNEIINYLDSHSSGSFSDLTNVATSPPFGIRPTLSALIILTIIIDRYSNMLFTRDDNYISNLSSKEIFEAGLNKNDFNYTYSDFDFQHREWMQFILQTFPNPSEGVLKKSQSIQVLSSLLVWFNSLPVIIQQGDTIGIEEKYFLRLIEKSKTNPFNALQELVKKDEETIVRLKESVDQAFEIYLFNMEKNLQNEFGIKNWSAWTDSLEVIKRKTNQLVKIACNSESVLRDYAKIIDTIEIERWTKGSYEKMVSLIRSDFLDASNKTETFTIEINGTKREIQDISIGRKAKNLKRNLVSLVDANSRFVTNSEIEKVLIELVEKYIK